MSLEFSSSEPGLSPRIVPWQSAFAALAAIAINTCLQDCGEVCDCHRDFSLLIRSSPLFCLVDTSTVLLQLCYYVPTRGLKHGIQIVASSRNQHVNATRTGSANLFWIVTRALLLVVAVVQALKLYSLQGIPLTQAAGACYLASYVVNAMLNLFGKVRSKLELDQTQLLQREDMVPRTSVIQLLKSSICLAHLIMWIAVGRSALVDNPIDLTHYAGIHHSIPLSVSFFMSFFVICMAFCLPMLLLMAIDLAFNILPAVLVMGLLSIPVWPNKPSIMGLIGYVLDIEYSGGSVVTIFILLLIASFTVRVNYISGSAVGYLTPALGKSLKIQDEYMMITEPYMYTSMVIAAAVALSYIPARIFMFGPLADKLRIRHLPIASDVGFAWICFFVGNIIVALTYYTVLYSPEGTYKPKWTDHLDLISLWSY